MAEIVGGMESGCHSRTSVLLNINGTSDPFTTAILPLGHVTAPRSNPGGLQCRRRQRMSFTVRSGGRIDQW